jgi:hypothetical protein
MQGFERRNFASILSSSSSSFFFLRKHLTIISRDIIREEIGKIQAKVDVVGRTRRFGRRENVAANLNGPIFIYGWCLMLLIWRKNINKLSAENAFYVANTRHVMLN